MGKLNVDGTEIQVLQIEEDDYISLTDMARSFHKFKKYSKATSKYDIIKKKTYGEKNNARKV